MRRTTNRVRPYRIGCPVTIRVEFTTRNSLPATAGLAEGSEVLDDRTLGYKGEDFLEAWIRSRAGY